MSRVPELIGWAISRYSPSAAFLLGIAINRPFSPSMTLISWITNSLSSVMDTIAFIFPSFSILLTRTSVTCIITSPICAPRRFYVITGQSIFECLFFCLLPRHPECPASGLRLPFYRVYLSFFSMTIFTSSGLPIYVVLARIVSRLSTMQFSITVLSPIYTSFKITEFLMIQLFPI